MKDFLDEFLQTEDGVVLVNLWEDWADACRLMEEVMRAVEEQRRATVRVLRLSLSEHRDWAADHQVEGTPCLLVFRGGELVGAIRGVVDLPTLLRRLDELEG